MNKITTFYSLLKKTDAVALRPFPPITTTQQHSNLRLVAWTYSLNTPNQPNGPLGYIGGARVVVLVYNRSRPILLSIANPSYAACVPERTRISSDPGDDLQQML